MTSRTESCSGDSRRVTFRRFRAAAELRRLLPILVVGICAGPVSAQQGIIEVAEPRHNFGVIPEGEIAYHVFTFSNTGDVPFHLTAVRPSCGCTIPDWTMDPIEPGEYGRIAVEFNSDGLPGPFRKSISVESTAAPSHVDLYIEGVVEPRSLARGDTLGSLVFGGFRTDLPLVKVGDPLAHVISIKNVGDQPVLIREAVTDADYVQVELPENEIGPGEIVEIVVAFDTVEMRQGPFSHRIDLMTTDRDFPIKEIRLMGLIH